MYPLRANFDLFDIEYFLDFVELNKPKRYEYINGHIFHITAVSPNHAAIQDNLSGILRPVLKDTPCRGFGAGLVVVAEDSYASMPDYTIVCGKPIIRQSKLGKAVTNPKLIVEILSPSNKPYDRHGKFENYKAITSFTDYLIIEQNDICVEHWQRTQTNRWKMSLYESLEDKVFLSSLNIYIEISEIYDNLDFES